MATIGYGRKQLWARKTTLQGSEFRTEQHSVDRVAQVLGRVGQEGIIWPGARCLAWLLGLIGTLRGGCRDAARWQGSHLDHGAAR